MLMCFKCDSLWMCISFVFLGAFSWIMMSGDSPTPHSELLLELKETSINAPVNVKCTQDKGVQFDPNHIEETTNSSLIHETRGAPELNHTLDLHQAAPLSRPAANRRSYEHKEDVDRIDEIPSTSHVDTQPLNRNEGHTSINIDESDGICLADADPKADESCAVQCLYYTLQCCDCTIL